MSGQRGVGRRIAILVLALGGWLAVSANASRSWAERPSAPKMLPAETLAYIRIHDTQEMLRAFQNTSLGKISADEEMRPLIGQLYGAAAQAFSQLEDRVGANLDQILTLPQGEFSLAMVPAADGGPAFVAIIEVGNQLKTAQTLIDKATAALEQQGGSVITETVGQVELSIYKQPGNDRRAVLFQREGVFVLATDLGVAKQLLSVWDGNTEISTLADNRQFVTIMKRSIGTRDERPQVSWFVDPMETARVLTKDNFTAQATLAVFPALGLTGLKGMGGTLILDTEEFDTISHLHVLLDSPPRGLLKILTFGNGETTPEPWVPEDAISYSTLYWEVQSSLDVITGMYDNFRGEGELDNLIRGRVSDRIGVDVKEELLRQMTGRYTFASWIEPPARLNSQCTLVGIQIRDPRAMDKTLAAIAARYPERIERKKRGAATCYQVKIETRRQLDSDTFRIPQPSFTVLGDYVVYSDSLRLLYKAIDTKQQGSKSLADSLQYKLIASRISRQLGTTEPGMISYARPEESLRLVYDLAKSDQTRQMLSRNADSNPLFGALNGALTDNPLPPFERLSQYLAPSGGMLTQDDTGIHYTSFSLRVTKP